MTPTAKPTKEKVFLAQLQREVICNFITLRDDEWMADKFGAEKLTSAFSGETLDIDVIFACFYRVMSTDDKKAVLACKVVEADGMELKELVFDDPVKKLRHIISGQKEITDIIVALTHTRVKSNPAIVEMLTKKMKPDQSPA